MFHWKKRGRSELKSSGNPLRSKKETSFWSTFVECPSSSSLWRKREGMHKGNEEEEEEGSLTHSPRAKARRGRGKEGKQPRIALSFLLASYVQRRRRRRRRRAPSSGGINLSPFCLPPPVMAPPRYHNIHQSDRPTDGRKGQGGGGGGGGDAS